MNDGTNHDRNGTNDMNDGTNHDMNGTNDRNDGTNHDRNGTNDMNDGTNHDMNGTNDMNDGTNHDRNGTNDMNDGTNHDRNGTNDMNDGTNHHTSRGTGGIRFPTCTCVTSLIFSWWLLGKKDTVTSRKILVFDICLLVGMVTCSYGAPSCRSSPWLSKFVHK